MAETDAHVTFDLPATFCKWPSLNSERLNEAEAHI